MSAKNLIFNTKLNLLNLSTASKIILIPLTFNKNRWHIL